MGHWRPVSSRAHSPEWRFGHVLGDRDDRVTHVQRIPARTGRHAPWPEWVRPELVARLRELGIEAPWTHQAEAASTAWSGRSVVISTGTASGKSLAFLLPALNAVI